MSNVRDFDGKNVESWIGDVQLYFDQNSTAEATKCHVAIAFLDADARKCLKCLLVALSTIKEAQWSWTWPKLKMALRGISSESFVLCCLFSRSFYA